MNLFGLKSCIFIYSSKAMFRDFSSPIVMSEWLSETSNIYIERKVSFPIHRNHQLLPIAQT